MDNLPPLEKGTYVVAVSGGVDSVALLDMLAKGNSKLQTPNSKFQLVVAHFDHGMRPDSKKDERFVAELAKTYGLEYESERQELGPAASEAMARQARYGFLARVQSKHGAISIITAHHADDVIETMIINLLRGTGWRGLCSLKSNAQVVRPLLAIPKTDILSYAKTHRLTWREDPTNSEQAYLRNAVRHQLIPMVDRQAWLDLYESQKVLASDVDQELATQTPRKRYDYIMLPPSVAQEFVKQNLNLTRLQAKRALLAIKTAKTGAHIPVGGGKTLTFTRDNFIVAPTQA